MRRFARFGTIYAIKKHEKHPWRGVTFSRVQGRTITIIIPYINKEPKNPSLYFLLYPALLIMNVFKGQMANKVKWLLQSNNIILQNVPLDF